VQTTLRARFIFPVAGPPIEHGLITLEDERIVAVGTDSTPDRTDVRDLGPVALVPGLVNAHTHLEFSALPRPLGTPGMALVDWIRLVIVERGHRHGNSSDAVQTGVRESLAHGVTSIGEIATGETPTTYREADVTSFVEVIGFSGARAASALSLATARLDELRRQGTTQFGLSPHAPYTVSLELLRRLVDLAQARNLPVAMHLAESTEELAFLHSGQGGFQQLLEERSMWDQAAVPRGSRPLDYLHLLASAPRSLVIHGNYLNQQERAFLVAHRQQMSLVYCPRTHTYFDHPPYPLAELLAQGASVALGTDSRASSPDLDLLAEMRHVARTHTNVDPNEILHLGTMAGALALGRSEEVGSLAPGKLANMVALPMIDRDCRNATDTLAGLLVNDVAPTTVWFRGQCLEQTPRGILSVAGTVRDEVP
jgi:cytosine/adenosine deaminase-related metal-dependent hydrolase